MRRIVAIGVVLCGLSGVWQEALAGGQAPVPDVLTRAREAYNAQRIDEAITLAQQAREVDRTAASAAVVLARASLERYRLAGDVADVAVARQALLGVAPWRLSASEVRELRLGTAELLFVDDHFGAAAEVLAGLLETLPADAPSLERERLFDWWASALDRHAQLGPEEDRQRHYARILAGAEREAGHTPSSVAALYWLAAACRGVEDLERAWSVAVAGWVQAPLVAPGGRGVTLQADLDRLMREAIIPERARRAAPPADPEALRVALAAEWDAIRKRWER